MAPPLTLLLLLLPISVSCLSMQSCDMSTNEVIINPLAQAHIGLVLPLREAGTDGFGCGSLNDNVEYVEVINWALQRINQNSGSINGATILDSYIPGIQLGVRVADSCSQTVFSTHSVVQQLPSLYSTQQSCQTDPSQIFLGYIGDHSKTSTEAVSQLLQLQGVPQISFSTSASTLSDKQKFPQFLRTAPSIKQYAQVYLELLKTLKWEQIGLIYTTDERGQDGYKQILEMSKGAGICIVRAAAIKPNESDSSVFKNTLTRLYDAGVRTLVYFGDTDTLSGLFAVASRQSFPEGRAMQWLTSVGTDRDFASQYQYSRGMLTIAPNIRPIPEFVNYWAGLDDTEQRAANPWYQEWYMTVNSCKITGTTQPPFASYPACTYQTEQEKGDSFSQGMYTEPALVTLYSYARALKTAHQSLCQGSPGICESLAQLSNEDFNAYLQQLDFTFTEEERIPSLASSAISPYNGSKKVMFDQNGDLSDVMFDVYNYKLDQDAGFDFIKVGSSMNGALELEMDSIVMYDDTRNNVLSALPMSACPLQGCQDCHYGKEDSRAPASVYIEGDILLAGLFGVRGPGGQDLMCGAVTSEGFQIAESVVYAINVVNDNGWLGNDIRLGAVICDHCSSPLIDASLLVDFNKRGMVNGKYVDPDSVQFYIGGYTLEFGIEENRVLKEFGFPLIYYGPEMDEEPLTIIVPHEVAHDSSQPLAMFVNRLGQKYVQVMYQKTTDFYHTFPTVDKIRATLSSLDICVAQVYEVNEPEEYREAILKAAMVKDAITIVTVGDAFHLQHLFDAIQATNLVSNFTIVSTPVWWKPSLQGYEDIEFYSLGNARTSIPNAGFLEHLNSLDVETYGDSNPWFNEWYETIHQCWIDESSMNMYENQCQPGVKPTDSRNYRESLYSIMSMNAVYAAVKSIRRTLVHYCGEDFTVVCAEYRNAMDRVDMLLDNFDAEVFHDAEGTLLDFSDWPAIVTSLNAEMADQGVYHQIGEYTVSYKDTPAMLELTSSAVMPRLMSTCSAPCYHCHYLDYPGQTMASAGSWDLFFGGLFNLHESGSDQFLCGSVAMDMAYQHYAAFRYAIDTINAGNGPVKLNDVKIGSMAFDSCESAVRSSSFLTGFYSGSIMDDEEVDIDDVVGWIHHSKATMVTTVLADTASALGTPLIGPNTDLVNEVGADLSSTYFTSMTGVETWSTGVVEVLERLGWSYVHVIVDDSPDMQRMYKAYQTIAQEQGICSLTLHRPHTTSPDDIILDILNSASHVSIVFMASPMDILRAKKARGSDAEGLFFILGNYILDLDGLNTAGVLTVMPDIMPVMAFDDYIGPKSLTSDMGSWFHTYYKALYDCDYGLKYEYGTPCDPDLTLSEGGRYMQDIWLSRTINSVYAMSAATHSVLQDLCGVKYQGVCRAFKESADILPRMVEALKSVSFTSVEGKTFTFDKNQQFDQGYNVYISGSTGDFEKFGVYRYNKLTVSDSSLSDMYRDVLSGCGTRCTVCLGADTTQDMFTSIPGDVIIGGAFDIHEGGSTPFTCGDINTRQGYQLLEAFNYAINYVNDESGIFDGRLNGVRLGGLGLDTCKSAMRISNSIANIHSQSVTLGRDSQQVNPDKIVAYVGGLDSDVSMKMADVLGTLGIPQISYGATSVSLKDMTRYPLFLRTVPSNDQQADALVAFLDYHHIDYVQVVHSDTLYGMDGQQQFSQKAHQAGICVSQQVTMTSTYGDIDINANKVVTQLLTRPKVGVVVVFLNADHILPFLQAVQRNQEAKASFRFIGSETWADNPEFLDADNDAEDVAKTSISLSVETSDLPEFDSYLDDITTTAQANSTWFREYYEYIYGCSLTDDIMSPDQCINPSHGLASAPDYQQDQYVLYTINAVFAAALGIDSALRRTCGDSYNGLCPEFLFTSEQKQAVFSGIREATFEDTTGQEFMFTDDGESNRGFQLYNVKTTQDGGASFNSIGSYEKTAGLKILDSFTLDDHWESMCSGPDSCMECSDAQPKPGRNDTTGYPLHIVGFFDVHNPDEDEPLKCGMLNTQGGFQNMLAFHYVLDQLVSTPKVVGIAIDTCGSSARVQQGVLSLVSGEGHSCDSDLDGLNQSNVVSYLTLGNADTAAVTGLTGNGGVLTVSPTATASSFLDLDHYLSAVPPDTIHAQIMSDVTKQMNWIYVSVIYSADFAGFRNAEKFIENSKDADQPVCVGFKAIMPQHATLEDAKAILTELQKNKGSNVVILFVTDYERDLLLQAAQELNLLGSHIFLGSGGLSDGDDGSSQSIIPGSLGIEPVIYPLNDFYTWVGKLSLDNHGSIPDDWFEEYYPQYVGTLTPSAEVYYTILATQMIVQGLIDLDQCEMTQGPEELADCFIALQDRYALLYEAIQTAAVNAAGTSDAFRFTEEGYGNLGLNIYNYQKTDGNGVKKEKIGSWDLSKGLTLNTTDFLSYTGDGEPKEQFTSQCLSGPTCSCLDGTGIDGSDKGGYSPQRPATEASVQQYTDSDFFSSPLGIILTVLTALGILISILLFVYLLIFYPVKGGTSVIGFILLFSVFLLYVLNFAFLVYPTYDVCGIRRFCLGFVYALIFACMLVKVLNTWRIGDAWDEINPPTYERLSHPCSLVAIVIGLTLVQVIIGAEWLILRHPDVELVEYEGKMLPRCSDSEDHNEELVMSCIYVMFLILLTMIFAAVTWDSEESNKESRWILVVCLFTTIIWIIWTILTTLASFKFRDPAIVLANLLNATTILLCIYIRKLYLLNKIQKEIDDERKSQFSTISREKPGNGYYVNPAYRTMEMGSVRSKQSSNRSQPSHHSYSYDRNPPGADVAY